MKAEGLRVASLSRLANNRFFCVVKPPRDVILTETGSCSRDAWIAEGALTIACLVSSRPRCPLHHLCNHATRRSISACYGTEPRSRRVCALGKDFWPMGAHFFSERVDSEGFAHPTYGRQRDF